MKRLDNRTILIVMLVLIVLIMFGRLMPHPPNFTPVAAAALFAGALLPRRLALTVPLAAMMMTDIVIGLHPLVPLTWGSFVLFALLSGSLFNKLTPMRVITGSIGASILFYLISNFGVWAEGRLYSRTLEGLFMSYWNGLPFLRFTLLGDLLFTVFLFSIYAVALRSRHKPWDENPPEGARI